MDFDYLYPFNSNHLIYFYVKRFIHPIEKKKQLVFVDIWKDSDTFYFFFTEYVCMKLQCIKQENKTCLADWHINIVHIPRCELTLYIE